MIIFRSKIFSVNNNIGKVITQITAKLDKEDITDYEVSDSVSSDSISIYPDLDRLKIYLPDEFEYEQFDLDSFIRKIAPSVRVVTKLDRNILLMELKGKITIDKLEKIIRYIIDQTDCNFCTLINDEDE